jgi:hypothetical protein
MIYKSNKTMPSIRSSCHRDLRNQRNRTVMQIRKAVDIIILEVLIERGAIIPVIPITKKIFAIFEPMIFPATIFPSPFRAAERATPSSGKEVPRATTLSPITGSGMCRRFAKKIAPSTRRLAPYQIATVLRRTIPRFIKRTPLNKGFAPSSFALALVS